MDTCSDVIPILQRQAAAGKDAILRAAVSETHNLSPLVTPNLEAMSLMVDVRGFEPLTSWVRSTRSPN